MGPRDGGPMAHVRLYGETSVVTERSTVSFGGLPAQILVLLTAARGSPVSVDHLLDVLWPESPSSGRNAVQRHLSSIRCRLRSHDEHELAERLVAHRSGTYRIEPAVASSDFDLDRASNPVKAVGSVNRPGGIAWWREPLAGLSWEPLAGERALLNARAVRVAHHWLGGDGATVPLELRIEILIGLCRRNPDDEILTTALSAAIDQSCR